MSASRRLPVGAVLVTAVLGGVAVGCGTADFADRTAEVGVDGRRTTYRIEEGNCGLDGDTIFLLGAADDGGVLQVVVGVDPDDPGAADPDRTGLTVSDGPVDLAAFGARAWSLRDGDGETPGRIDDVTVRGARIGLTGTARPVDADGRRIDGEERPVDLDARCSDLDD